VERAAMTARFAFVLFEFRGVARMERPDA
jgi:hypothetical protein